MENLGKMFVKLVFSTLKLSPQFKNFSQNNANNTKSKGKVSHTNYINFPVFRFAVSTCHINDDEYRKALNISINLIWKKNYALNPSIYFQIYDSKSPSEDLIIKKLLPPLKKS